MPPRQPSDAPTFPPITLPPDYTEGVLFDAVVAFNALVKRGLVKLFPVGLPPELVRADLQAHVDSELEWRDATKGVTKAVEVKRGKLKEGKRVYKRMRKLIDSDFPMGTTGRGDFFPHAAGEHPVGALLVAAADGAEKHGTELPEAWTPGYLRQLGQDALAAEAARDGVGVARKGKSTTRTNRMPRTREIRRRLREKIEGFFGEDHPDLPQFGIPVRAVRTPRRRKATAPVTPAVAPPIAAKAEEKEPVEA